MAKVRTHRGDAPGDRRGCEAVGAHCGDPALELVERRVPDCSVSEGMQRREVAPIGVDGPRRPAGLEGEQEALDVGVGATHGARPDSADESRLLLQAPRARSLRRSAVLLAALVGGVVALSGSASATAGAQSVVAYPSSQSIAASGVLPRGGSGSVAVNAAIGDRENGILVVRGAKRYPWASLRHLAAASA